MIIIVGNHFFSFSSKKRATNKTGKGISLLNGFFSPVCVDLFAFVFNLSCCAMSKWKCRKQVRSSFIVMIFVRKLKRDTLKYVIRNSLNSRLTIQCYSYVWHSVCSREPKRRRYTTIFWIWFFLFFANESAICYTIRVEKSFISQIIVKFMLIISSLTWLKQHFAFIKITLKTRSTWQMLSNWRENNANK